MSSTPEPPAPDDDSEPTAEPPQGYASPPPGGMPQSGPAAYGPPPSYPGGVPASGFPVPGPQPPAGPKRPPVWAGLLAGVGLQIAGLIVMLLLLSVSWSVSAGNWGLVIMLLPFIVLLVGPALLMISWRWRRFATGVLIISAATWIIIIGPCLGLAFSI